MAQSAEMFVYRCKSIILSLQIEAIIVEETHRNCRKRYIFFASISHKVSQLPIRITILSISAFALGLFNFLTLSLHFSLAYCQKYCRNSAHTQQGNIAQTSLHFPVLFLSPLFEKMDEPTKKIPS